MRRHIVRFLGFGLGTLNDLRTAFLLLERLDGGTLASLFVANGTSQVRRAVFDARCAMRWACELTGAVACLHGAGAGIVHRDIKLENVLLSCRDHRAASVKLADFGLAVQLRHRQRCSGGATVRELQVDGGAGVCQCSVCGPTATPEKGPAFRSTCLDTTWSS